jgi:hypothetical protein
MYDLIFSALLHETGAQPLRVLELGVSLFGEGSGHAFSRMPCVEKFVGVDLMPLKQAFGGCGVFIQGEAYDARETRKQVEKHGPFHLLIDDGSHLLADQITFFQRYVRLCATPSVMVCEDVHANHVQKILMALNDKTLQVVSVPDLYGLNYSNMLIKSNFFGACGSCSLSPLELSPC